MIVRAALLAGFAALSLGLAPIGAKAQQVTYYQTITPGDLIYWVAPGILGDAGIGFSGSYAQFPQGIVLDQGGGSPTAYLLWYGAGQITSPAAAVIQVGPADDAAPEADAVWVRNVVPGTSNGNGGGLLLGCSMGTGTGFGGSCIVQVSPAGSAGTSRNVLVNFAIFDAKFHLGFVSPATPAVTSCGSGAAMVAGSTDVAGGVTIGATATACTIAFKIAYAAAPFCALTDKSVVSDLTSYTVSTTAIALTMTSNSGDVVEYVCHGN